ncbi:hypothetical protein FRC03_002774 [Tulasnella sp. 419]|nr:hypothetical protein FRC03_002774 [Tulasnella sp. 419]
MELLILYPDDHDWVHMASKLRLLPCLKHLTIIFNDEPEYAASYLVNALYLRVLRENSAEQLLLPQLKRLTVRGGCDLEYLATLMRRKHEEEDTIDTYLGLEKLEVQLLVGEEDGDPLITEISSYFQALNIVFENIIPSSAM